MEAAEAHINFSDRRFKRIPTIEATHQKIQKRIATIKSRLVSEGIAIQVRNLLVLTSLLCPCIDRVTILTLFRFKDAGGSTTGTRIRARKKHNLTELDDTSNLNYPVGCIVMVNYNYPSRTQLSTKVTLP